MKPKNLKELFEMMKNNDPELPEWSSLPTFGGSEPSCTAEIWSWDENYIIVGTCSGDLKLISRSN